MRQEKQTDIDRERQTGALEAPPVLYLEKLKGRKDVKGLSNDHRLLHAWAAELYSLSPTTIIGNGWTLKTIKVAHDKVIDRIMMLKPEYKHESPISAAAFWKTPIRPILVEENFVSVVGSRLLGKEADLDLLIPTEARDERVETELSKALEESIHIIYDKKGVGERKSVPLYHLMLVPAEWSTKIEVNSAISTALETYEKKLDGAGLTSYRRILGAGLLKTRIRKHLTRTEAETIGLEAAEWAVSDKPIPPFTLPSSKPIMAAGWNEDQLFDVAVEIYASMMIPVENATLYADGVQMIIDQIAEWVGSDPFKDLDEAMDAARELGNQTAEQIKTKIREQVEK